MAPPVDPTRPIVESPHSAAAQDEFAGRLLTRVGDFYAEEERKRRSALVERAIAKGKLVATS